MNSHKTSNHRPNIPRNNHKRNIKFMYDTLDWRYNRWIIFIAHDHNRRHHHDHHMVSLPWMLRFLLLLFVCQMMVFSATRPFLHSHSLSHFVSISRSFACYIMLCFFSCLFVRVSVFSLIWLHIHACALAHRCVIYWIFLSKYSKLCRISVAMVLLPLLFYSRWKSNGVSKSFEERRNNHKFFNKTWRTQNILWPKHYDLEFITRIKNELNWTLYFCVFYWRNWRRFVGKCIPTEWVRLMCGINRATNA